MNGSIEGRANAPEDQNDPGYSSSTFTERAMAVGEAGLFTLTLVLTVIAVPLILLSIVIINISGSILAATVFELLGHLLLRAYDRPSYDLRLITSVKVGAIGGAIAAIPFNLIYSALEGLVAPQVLIVSTEEGTEPLLPQQDTGSMGRTSRMLNDNLRRTRRNPIGQSLYAGQQLRVETPSKARVWLAIIADICSGPVLGALSGTFGSLVLHSMGEDVLEVSKAAAAGALGGFVLGPLAAFVFSGVFAVGMTAWLSYRSR